MKFSELVDPDELKTCLEEGLISVRYSDDGYEIYNYTNRAMFTPGAWDIPAVLQCRGIIVDPKTQDIIARPWRKFFNHNQPEAGELNLDSPVEVTDKKDGCFSNKTRLNLWGGGTITIGEVVKNKLTPTLIGMNADGDLVPSRVTNWFDNGLKDNWLRVGLSTPASSKSGAAGFPNRMFVTPNHQVLHGGKYVPIGSLNVGDSLTSYTKSFSGLDLFLGGLLGDGSVCRNGNGANYQECHGESQRAYVEEQKALFSEGLVNREDTRGGYANSLKVWLGTQNAQVFKDLRNEWYPEGTKRVPYDLSFMNDAVVAKWFMDVGSRTHSPLQQDRAIFHTNGFIEEDVRRLAAWLEDEYGVTAKVFDSKGWSIRLNYAKGTIRKFWEAIAPYIFPSMDYKLPEEYRGKFAGFPAPSMILLPIESLITSIEEDPKWQENNYGRARTRAYDIETETHNYMCQGVLVHNSLGIIYRNALGVPCVATRGSFNSDQAIWATQWMKDNEPLAKILWPILDVWTLLVEIVYPDNRIVVDYQDYEGLILLGAVHKERGEYLSPLAFTGIWEKDIVETFPYRSLREALEAKPRPGKEGLCIRYTDSDKIVKIKQEDYLQVHRRVFGLSRKTVWEYVYHTDNPSLLDLVEGLPDEFLTWVTNVWEEIQGRIDRLTTEAHTRYTKIIAELPPNPERKQVAEKILSKENKIYAPLLFKLLDGQDLKDTAMKYIRSEFQGSDRVKVSDESTA